MIAPRPQLEAEDLVDEDDGHAPRDDFAVDDQNLVDTAVDAVDLEKLFVERLDDEELAVLE